MDCTLIDKVKKRFCKFLYEHNLINSENYLRKNDGLVVILIDMQQEFINEFKHGEEKRIIPKQISVIRQCARFGIPVVVLEYRNCGHTIAALADELKNVANVKTIVKRQNDGFKNTALEYKLRDMNAKQLFFMGINSQYCVKETAESAIKLGFTVVTSNDVITGPNDDNDIDWYKKNGTVLPAAPAP